LKKLHFGQTERGKTVYPPPPSGSGGIIIVSQKVYQILTDAGKSSFLLELVDWRLTPLSTIFQLYRGGKLLGKLPFVEKCAV
jgi:hypothetical protein